METFNFPIHEVRDDFPPGDSIRFGGGYEFTVEPLLPVQRKFNLAFSGMRWVKNEAGVLVNNLETEVNMLRLYQFCEAHLTWKRFIYPHELHGNRTVVFDQPFKQPKSLKGGTGWTEGFELVLREQP